MGLLLEPAMGERNFQKDCAPFRKNPFPDRKKNSLPLSSRSQGRLYLEKAALPVILDLFFPVEQLEEENLRQRSRGGRI